MLFWATDITTALPVVLIQHPLCLLIPSTGKKAARKLSDVEEEEENETPDLEEEGEKENEDLCNDGGSPVSKSKKKRKRKNKEDASTEEPNDKKNKTGEKSKEQGTGVFSYFMTFSLRNFGRFK